MSYMYRSLKERSGRQKNPSVSFFGLLVSVLFFFGLVSAISAVQAQFIESPIRVTERKTIAVSNKIKDNVSSSKVSSTKVKFVSNKPVAAAALTSSVATTSLANLPFEKKWPIRGSITTWFSSYHPAIDIAAPWGTPIKPFASGVVSYAGWMGGFGNTVVVKHTNGWETLYAHMGRIDVKQGQKVSLTTTLGVVGSTGYSTGPHLHLQLTRNGGFVNPLSYLP